MCVIYTSSFFDIEKGNGTFFSYLCVSSSTSVSNMYIQDMKEVDILHSQWLIEQIARMGANDLYLPGFSAWINHDIILCPVLPLLCSRRVECFFGSIFYVSM